MLVQEKEKFTLTVDESDILTLSQKIQKYKDEDKAFSESLDKYFSNTEKTTEPLIVGATPNSLAVSGANPDLNVVIAPRTIAKCMAEADEKYHGHGLSADIMKQLPEQLRNPAMIFKGNKDNSLVAITELKDKENREIMISVKLNEVSGRQEVNRISSAYGRNNMINFLKAQMEQGNLIACNKEKANEMLQSAGLQLPLEETFISFDNSIAYSDENVKTVHPKNYRKNAEKLLPFINMKYRYHLSQIDNFTNKKAECNDKINYHQSKIEKLRDKADRLEHTNEILKGMSFNSVFKSLINSYIKRNEAKIQRINSELIPKHERKIEIQKREIAKLDHKIAVHQCKADKLFHFSNLVKSFFILNWKKRHEQFTTSLDGLHDASKRSLQFKIDKCDANINKLNSKYLASNSEVEKYDLSHKLNDLKSRQSALTAKLNKLNKASISFSEQSEGKINTLMADIEKQLTNALEKSDDLSIAALADDISVSAAESVLESDKSIEQESVSEKVQNEPTVEKSEAHITEQDKSRKNYEKINPDFYKSLDKKDIYTKRLSDDVADNVMQQLDAQGVEYSAVRLAKDITGITVHKDFKEVFDEAFNNSFKEVKAQKIQERKEAKSYNSEYYVSLPKENRFIAEFATSIAQKYIDELKSENCEYSYRIKETDRMAVTIDNRDSKALKVYNNFTNSLDVNQARGSVIDELSERGFSKEKLNFIQNLIEDPSLQGKTLFAFVDKLRPEYDNNQIHTIYDKITEIYSQPEIDRIGDENNLFEKLTEQIKAFDYEVNLNKLIEGFNYSEEQKEELLNALKSDIPTDVLYAQFDELYSPKDIHEFVDAFKNNDMEAIYKLTELHKEKMLQLDNDLRDVIKNRRYTEKQKDELFDALKSDVPVDALSKLDESYSAEDIHNFVAVYKTYDLDKIDKFHQEHKSQPADTVKKTFTMSRGRMRDTAQKVSGEKRELTQKSTQQSIQFNL